MCIYFFFLKTFVLSAIEIFYLFQYEFFLQITNEELLNIPNVILNIRKAGIRDNFAKSE